jgi:hypothetical protein
MNERHDVTTEEAFAGKAKSLFDESVAGLDGASRSRLNQSRHAALAELDSGHRRYLQWVPAGGLAATAVVAFVVWSGAPQPGELAAPVVASDMEILLTEDSLEMLEDLDFYSWIDFESETEQLRETANNVG